MEAPLLIVEADGGSRGNPGHAGYGALVRDPKTGAILVEKAGYIGKASNNVAEYSGLVAGLELAHEINPVSRIHVKMDSKLVVEQMSGRWQIKHADMRTLAARARKIVDPRRVTYEWIPRERNKDADRLSNEAMDAGMAGVPWKPRTVKGLTATAPAPDAAPEAAPPRRPGRLHHLEVWVADLDAARQSLGWLLERLGFTEKDSWAHGVSYSGEGFYLVLEAGPDVQAAAHERRRPGLNHLAFQAGSRSEVDLLARRAASHGWTLLFPDRHPFAGGAEHYAAYLENAEGFEVELVAGEA
ncbi:reverse transcriptase-like protein [Arthrobacter sp. TMN-37]